MTRADSAGGADLQLHVLVLRCQAGDENAFAQLFDRFASRTLAHLRSFVGDDAEDVQQEVWLTVYRSLRGLSNPGAFGPGCFARPGIGRLTSCEGESVSWS
jgi:RNA polymerase sigma-70 factor (ECF subfamily)